MHGLPEIISNTSPLRYLFQLGMLHLLPALAHQVIIPPAVVDELRVGRELGVNLPNPAALDWLVIRRPASASATRLVTDLGPGETEVLMLAIEATDPIVIFDDMLARRIARSLGIRLTGTLGVLLDAKRAELIPTITPLLDRLQSLRLRLSSHTRAAILKLAREEP
jgi:predicted nucleic acid-binding protein